MPSLSIQIPRRITYPRKFSQPKQDPRAKQLQPSWKSQDAYKTINSRLPMGGRLLSTKWVEVTRFDKAQYGVVYGSSPGEIQVVALSCHSDMAYEEEIFQAGDQDYRVPERLDDSRYVCGITLVIEEYRKSMGCVKFGWAVFLERCMKIESALRKSFVFPCVI